MALDGFITIDSTTPSESGLYVVGLPGVTVAQLNGLTKDEQADNEETFEYIYALSQTNLKIDVQRALAQRFHIDKKLVSRETSKFLAEENAADELAGVQLSFNLSKYSRTNVVSVGLDVVGFNAPQDWELIETGEVVFDISFTSIAYGDGKFIAVSNDGQIIISEDNGETWQLTEAPSKAWQDIAYGDGKWVAIAIDVTGGDEVGVSTDGINWTMYSTGIAVVVDESRWVSVAYGNGVWVIVRGEGTTRVIYSEDGETWSGGTPSATATWTDLTFGGGRFVAIANSQDAIMFSFDGSEWTSASTVPAGNYLKITYGDGTFVTVGSNFITTSEDADTWTSRPPADSAQLNDVTFGNGFFAAIASEGASPIKTSPDGITWTAQPAIEGPEWYRIAHGGNYFVCVSYNYGVLASALTKQVMRSPDGALVEINFYEDDEDGELLHTITSAVTEGKNLIEVNEEFEVDDLFISIDPTRYRFNKTENKYYDGNTTRDKLSCTFPCALGEGSVSQINGGGLNVKFNVYCSFEKMIEDNINFFKYALWYRIGVDLMKERIVSDRVSRFTTLTAERAAELMAVFNEDYKAALDSATMNLKFNEDTICFQCKRPIVAKTSLP